MSSTFSDSASEMGMQLNLLLVQMCLIVGVLPFHGSAGNKFEFLVSGLVFLYFNIFDQVQYDLFINLNF